MGLVGGEGVAWINEKVDTGWSWNSDFSQGQVDTFWRVVDKNIGNVCEEDEE